MEGTLVLSLKLLSKAFLHSLPSVSRSISFSKVWLGVLNCMECYTKVKFRGKRSENIYELVPELLKNTLLVMKSKGILSPSDGAGPDGVWEQTWLHVKTLSPLVQSEVFPDDEPQTMAATPVPEVGLV
ncbi:ARF guanine-nucleotide exchange factor GNL1-like [Rutidosis leptorrhynchoides]|uniref:ARF guanine-nucleotide exchange factor GNL1-like n=1 Tax=Rutidosis leptorrhynchoides TaxID=125765 RepID=UPI003A999B0E